MKEKVKDFNKVVEELTIKFTQENQQFWVSNVRTVKEVVEEKKRPKHLENIAVPQIRFESRRRANELDLIAGSEVSWLRLGRIFDKDFGKFKEFVLGAFFNQDEKLRWSKFCVSKTAWNRLDGDDKLIYFELKKGENKNPRVVFLGIGKPLGDVQVYCGYAAETLGYKFLGLGK